MDVLMVFLIIIAITIIVALKLSSSAPSVEEYMKNQPKELDFFEDSFGSAAKYSFLGNGTGIGISDDLKRIGLISFNKSKIYNTDQIRGHKISDVTPGQIRAGHVIGGGMQGAGANIGYAIRASIENKKLQTEARDESGLFIDVKDIDNPEWHIRMYDRTTQKRWHEILTQLYEGTLSTQNTDTKEPAPSYYSNLIKTKKT